MQAPLCARGPGIAPPVHAAPEPAPGTLAWSARLACATIPPTAARGLSIPEPLTTVRGVATLVNLLSSSGGFIQGRPHGEVITGMAERLREKVYASRAQAAGLPAPGGLLPGGGISERPTGDPPPTMGYGIPSTGPLFIPKPFIPSIFDGQVGGGPGGGARPVVPSTHDLDEPFNPQGIPTVYPEWDWGAWDKANPNWGGTTEEETMAIDWGAAASGAIDILQGQRVGGGSFAGVPPIDTSGWDVPGYEGMPAKVTVDTRTGKVCRCRRRRRRRLLTPTDLSDLAALAAVVGKGDALKLAVAKAVRR